VLLGLYSLHLSALPPGPTAAAAATLCLAGLIGLRRLARQRPRSLVVPWNSAPARVDGRPVAGLRVEWRGPLAWVSWRRGPRRREHLMFWPDTLPLSQRRELRLAARHRAVTPIRRQWHHSLP